MKLEQRIRLTNEYLKLVSAYWRDMKRYAKHACLGWNRSQYDERQLEGRIIATYHVIEKGLCMPDFRPCFGVSTVKSLIRMCRDGRERFSWDANVNCLSALKVLNAYKGKHAKMGVALNSHFTDEELAYGEEISNDVVTTGGWVNYSRDEYFSDAQSAFDLFAKSRHSCRVFDPEKPIDHKKLSKAIEVARYTPSVCNRQCWRLHVHTDRSQIEEIFKYQEGNRGFGHTVPALIVVTAELKVFDAVVERNQAFIDGGLFSMSLMYALHHQEMGCVPMNWCATKKNDDALRLISSLADNEVVVMLLAIGVPSDQFAAPVSCRRSVEDIVTFY